MVNGVKKTFDFMGTSAAYTAKNFGNGAQFRASIIRHVRKSVDYVVIDLKGATQGQINYIKSIVSQFSKAHQDKIKYLQSGGLRGRPW